MQEIERKYLLKDSIISLIQAHKLPAHKITQFYTTITESKGVRYRQMDTRYFKTVKQGMGAAREEIEVPIDEKKFHKKYKKRIKTPIRKNRYFLMHEGEEYAIDVFKKELKGIYFMEIEFPSMQALQAFTLPSLLKPYVIKEVTYDEAYKNKNMTLHGKPTTAFDLSILFTKLDGMSIAELERYYIPTLSPINALSVILYKFSLGILFYKDQILLHQREEDLHQFRVYIRKSRAFLKAFSSLIPKETYSNFYKTLSTFASTTNHKRDLDVIKERLEHLDKNQKIIQKDIAKQQKTEYLKINKMLKSKHFEHFFHTYQSTLKTSTLVTPENSVGDMEIVAKEILENLQGNIVKKINTLEKAFSITKLHKIRIRFKKLRYMLEEFQHIFEKHKVEKILKNVKTLQTLLGDFNDTVNQQKLLHNYFKEHQKTILHSKKMEVKLVKKTAKMQKKLLKETIQALHQFKKKPFTL